MNFKDLPLEQKLEIGLGMKEGDRKIKEAVAQPRQGDQRVEGPLPYQATTLTTMVIGWSALSPRRAGIYGNDAVEAMYPLTRVDAEGQTLDGSKHDYTLTFPPDQQPPVNSFWSLTMYDGKDTVADREPYQSLSDQFADDPRDENQRGRLSDTVHPEQIPGRR